MKIAILHCRKASDVCTGAACLNAYHNRKKSFAQYGDENLELAAFFDCGGCGIDRAVHSGMQEKLERLRKEAVCKIHIGVCIDKKCPEMDNIIAMLEQYRIPYEFGTH